jgi:Uma2 family endonuclease
MMHHALHRPPRLDQPFEPESGVSARAASRLPRHQVVLRNVARLFEAFADLHGGLSLTGPLDLTLPGMDVVQPDLMFFSDERRHLVDLDEPLSVLPDIVVEVVSAGGAPDDRGMRLRLYVQHGVPEYWLVDALTSSIEVYRQDHGRYVRTGRATGHERARSVWIEGLSFLAGAAFLT